MEISNKKTLIWSVIFILTLILSLFILFWTGIYGGKTNLQPVYSVNSTESKNLLVPTDFPFPENILLIKEFQREIDGILEYTKVWETTLTNEENRKIYGDYLSQNGWEVFAMEMGEETIFISGTKGAVGVSIFIGKNPETLMDEVQTHFTQTK